jgi:translation elongation factor EF-1alpha
MGNPKYKFYKNWMREPIVREIMLLQRQLGWSSERLIEFLMNKMDVEVLETIRIKMISRAMVKYRNEP